MLSYASSLRRRFRENHTLAFFLRMNIGSVVLIYSVYAGAILALTIDPISYFFNLWTFEYLQGNPTGSCIFQTGKGGVRMFS